MNIARPIKTERIGASALGPAVAVIVLLVTSAMTMPAARAQHCGSFVVRGGDEAMTEWLGLSTVTMADSVPDEPARPFVPPCDGPGCSRAPASPGSGPTQIVPPPSVEHWAITVQEEPDDPHFSSLRPRSEETTRLDPPTGDVFHPPRSH